MAFLSQIRLAFDGYKFVVVVAALVVAMVVGVLGWYKYAVSYPAFPVDKELSKLSFQGQITMLQRSHLYYTTEMTKEELDYVWAKLYSKARYESGGDGKHKRFDCLSSVWYALKYFGAYLILEDIPSMVNRFTTLEKLGRITVRNRNGYDVRTGDIIVFNPVKGRWHVGLVYQRVNGYIQYLDFNAAVGMDRPKVRIGDPSIRIIVQPSFDYWTGELLAEKQERERRL